MRVRKPQVTLQSIADDHERKSVDRIVVRRGGEKLRKVQPKTVRKL